MNRAFPAETIKACEHCGREITVIILDDGGFEANDPQDYVWADPGADSRDHVFVCAECRVAHGLDD